jgi:hypothetical protein
LSRARPPAADAPGAFRRRSSTIGKNETLAISIKNSLNVNRCRQGIAPFADEIPAAAKSDPFAHRDETTRPNVTKHHQKVDLRPFQSKADYEREDSLRAHYGELGIPEVVAALRHRKPAEAKPARD